MEEIPYAYKLLRKDVKGYKLHASRQYTIDAPYDGSRLNKRGMTLYLEALQRWKRGDIQDSFTECHLELEQSGRVPHNLDDWKPGGDIMYSHTSRQNVVLSGTLTSSIQSLTTSSIVFLDVYLGFALTKSGSIYNLPKDIDVHKVFGKRFCK